MARAGDYRTLRRGRKPCSEGVAPSKMNTELKGACLEELGLDRPSAAEAGFLF